MMARDRHAPIVEAIAGGDAAAAVTVVEEHMAAAARQYAPDA
jgi:DNA-binding GntR family transcriptional regulator